MIGPWKNEAQHWEETAVYHYFKLFQASLLLSWKMVLLACQKKLRILNQNLFSFFFIKGCLILKCMKSVKKNWGFLNIFSIKLKKRFQYFDSLALVMNCNMKHLNVKTHGEMQQWFRYEPSWWFHINYTLSLWDTFGTKSCLSKPTEPSRSNDL